MKPLIRTAAIAAACAMALPAQADESGKPLADFITEYLRIWNTFDAASLAKNIYRIPGESEEAATARFTKTFADLKAQNYGSSKAFSAQGCLLAPDSGFAILRFQRLLADGKVMGPERRSSMYMIRKFPDGWRIVGTAPISNAAKIECSTVAS